MTSRQTLAHLAQLYNKGTNIIQYLRSLADRKQNTTEDIMISYDFQAGSYIKGYEKDPEGKKLFLARLADIIDKLDCEKKSIFEAGVGEATSLIPLLQKMKSDFVWQGGCDISYSRIMYANKFSKRYTGGGMPEHTYLCVGDMFSLPLADDAIDIVYTIHAMEPNGGHEEELLKELYRVTKAYLILLEPAYEFADAEARSRMETHGYVRDLYGTATRLGYKVEEHSLYGMSVNPLNPTGLIIIRKNSTANIEPGFADPLTKTPLKKIGNAYYSEDSMLAYPIMNDIPCLLPENAVVATKFMDSV